MESKFRENNPYSIFMIKNFNVYTKFFTPKKGTPRFITWTYSSARACKMMRTISEVYKFRERSSIWHRRGIFLAQHLNKTNRKRESKWDDKFYLLSERLNCQKKIKIRNLYDSKAIYVTTSLNCYARDYKNMKKYSSSWKNTLGRIQRDFSTTQSKVGQDKWELAFRRSFRSFLAGISLWESRFSVFVKYWNK
jgi:hypothetical protein